MIDSWFPTLISHEVLEEFKDRNSYFSNKAYSIQKNNENLTGTSWNCDTYNTLGKFNYKLDNDQQINQLINICKLKVLEFSRAGNYTSASYKSCFYTPKESMILIFRSNLLHMVEKNNSDTDRISIAMNFRFN